MKARIILAIMAVIVLAVASAAQAQQPAPSPADISKVKDELQIEFDIRTAP